MIPEIILDTIVQNNNILLKNIGVLSLKYNPAYIDKQNQQLFPPSHEIILVPETEPYDVDLIDKIAQYNYTAYNDAYHVWCDFLATEAVDEVLTIENVVMVNLNTMDIIAIDPLLQEHISPDTEPANISELELEHDDEEIEEEVINEEEHPNQVVEQQYQDVNAVYTQDAEYTQTYNDQYQEQYQEDYQAEDQNQYTNQYADQYQNINSNFTSQTQPFTEESDNRARNRNHNTSLSQHHRQRESQYNDNYRRDAKNYSPKEYYSKRNKAETNYASVIFSTLILMAAILYIAYFVAKYKGFDLIHLLKP